MEIPLTFFRLYFDNLHENPIDIKSLFKRIVRYDMKPYNKHFIYIFLSHKLKNDNLLRIKVFVSKRNNQPEFINCYEVDKKLKIGKNNKSTIHNLKKLNIPKEYEKMIILRNEDIILDLIKLYNPKIYEEIILLTC